MNDRLNRTFLSVIVERLIWGKQVALPPRAAPIAVEKLRGFAGTYVLENGGEFQVLRDDAGFKVKAADRQAILALIYPDAALGRDSDNTQPLDPRISEVLFGFEQGDFAPLQAVLFKQASFEKAKEAWSRRWRFYQRSLGSLQSIRVMHRLETEYNGAPEVQTHLFLKFEKGNRLLRALADADGRYWFDLINLPRQLELPFVTVSDTELASWDLKLRMGPRLQRDEKDGNTLRILGPAGQWKATRKTSD